MSRRIPRFYNEVYGSNEEEKAERIRRYGYDRNPDNVDYRLDYPNNPLDINFNGPTVGEVEGVSEEQRFDNARGALNEMKEISGYSGSNVHPSLSDAEGRDMIRSRRHEWLREGVDEAVDHIMTHPHAPRVYSPLLSQRMKDELEVSTLQSHNRVAGLVRPDTFQHYFEHAATQKHLENFGRYGVMSSRNSHVLQLVMANFYRKADHQLMHAMATEAYRLIRNEIPPPGRRLGNRLQVIMEGPNRNDERDEEVYDIQRSRKRERGNNGVQGSKKPRR